MRIYARPSALLVRQIVVDVLIVLWVWGWWKLSTLAAKRIEALAAPADASVNTLSTIGNGIDQAGDAAASIPLVGEQIRRPLGVLSGEVSELMQTASAQAEATRHTAQSVGFWMFFIPTVIALVWFAWRKYRYAKVTAQLAALAAMPGGELLLAWRAIANVPLSQLAHLPQAVAGLQRAEPVAVRTLANLARIDCGMAPLHPQRQQGVTNM